MWDTGFKVSSNEVDYPDGAPRLQFGIEYLPTVEAINGKSSCEDRGANLGFVLLDQDDVEDVKEKEEKIKILPDSSLKKEEKDLALAALYSYEYLITDAIEKLENLVDNPEIHTAFVYRWLGDLYTRQGLNLKAQEYYSKAIELLTVAQDSYELAKAKAGLALVKVMLGQRDTKLEDQAKDGYQALGYSEMVEELERQLEKAVNDLRKPIPPDETLTPWDLEY